MPTYDYHCDACEHEFELFQSIKDDPIKKCPKCGKPKARRLFGTGAAIMFKGSGFYKTDYRSESYKKRAAEDKPSDSSGKSESKSESKSDSSGTKPAGDKPSGGKSSGSKPSGDSGGKAKD